MLVPIEEVLTMAMKPGKKNLTTGDIAKMLGVNFRTVIRWIERGHLRAFQLPGRGDNRVLVRDFLEFLSDNHMPIPDELQPQAKKVLIVEDDEHMAQAMSRALKRKGFETMVAPDGFMAGSLATAGQPAVMTLDLKMPGLGGLEVLKAIRKNPDLAGIKIIVVSAMPRDQLEEALDAGADMILEKPFENKKLVAKVAELAGVDAR
jgi:excisionase family DNA binding protein